MLRGRPLGGRREGQAAMLLRQEQVQKLALRGLKPPEISKQIGVSIRTVERDLRTIRANLMQIVQAHEIRTLKLANAELDEIWREAWVLYHRPPREIPANNGLAMIKEDDRPMKAKLLTILTQISGEKNRLMLPQIQPGLAALPIGESKASTVAEFINSLPGTLRNGIVGHLKQQLVLPPKSP
jgi:hypothetical protein